MSGEPTNTDPANSASDPAETGPEIADRNRVTIDDMIELIEEMGGYEFGGDETVLDLLESFLVSSKSRAERLDAAFTAGDWAAIRGLSHDLKAAAAWLKLEDLRAAALELEIAPADPDLLATVRQDLIALPPRLRRLLNLVRVHEPER